MMRCDTYTSLTPSLPYPSFSTDRTELNLLHRLHHLTSPHTNQRRNKAIDTHTNEAEAEAEDAEQESRNKSRLHSCTCMLCMLCMYTTRRMGVPEHELSQGAELHFLFDHDNCPVLPL
jgi:hypothetical protein